MVSSHIKNQKTLLPTTTTPTKTENKNSNSIETILQKYLQHTTEENYKKNDGNNNIIQKNNDKTNKSNFNSPNISKTKPPSKKRQTAVTPYRKIKIGDTLRDITVTQRSHIPDEYLQSFLYDQGENNNKFSPFGKPAVDINSNERMSKQNPNSNPQDEVTKLKISKKPKNENKILFGDTEIIITDEEAVIKPLLGNSKNTNLTKIEKTVSKTKILPTTLFTQFPQLVFVFPLLLYFTILFLYPINCFSVKFDLGLLQFGSFNEFGKSLGGFLGKMDVMRNEHKSCVEPLPSYLIEPSYSYCVFLFYFFHNFGFFKVLLQFLQAHFNYGLFNLAMGQFLVLSYLFYTELFALRTTKLKYQQTKNAKTKLKIVNIFKYVKFCEFFTLGVFATTTLETNNYIHTSSAILWTVFALSFGFVDLFYWYNTKKLVYLSVASCLGPVLFLMNPLVRVFWNRELFVVLEHVG